MSAQRGASHPHVAFGAGPYDDIGVLILSLEREEPDPFDGFRGGIMQSLLPMTPYERDIAVNLASELFDHFLTVPQKRTHMCVERFLLRRVETMFQGVLVALGRARPGGTAVHAAALLARNRGRLARRALAGFRTTAQRRFHWAGITRVI